MTGTGGHRLHGEEGVTLVELLTAIAISGVVLAFVTGTVVNALKSQRRQTTHVAALNDAKLAFERVTRDLRAADPLQVAALDRISVDLVRADASTRTVTYARSGDSLVATDSSTGQTTALVDDLAVGHPLFLYHLVDGSTATGQATVNPRSVSAVTVQLQIDAAGAEPVVDLKNRVVLRNARSR